MFEICFVLVFLFEYKNYNFCLMDFKIYIWCFNVFEIRYYIKINVSWFNWKYFFFFLVVYRVMVYFGCDGIWDLLRFFGIWYLFVKIKVVNIFLVIIILGMYVKLWIFCMLWVFIKLDFDFLLRMFLFCINKSIKGFILKCLVKGF